MLKYNQTHFLSTKNNIFSHNYFQNFKINRNNVFLKFLIKVILYIYPLRQNYIYRAIKL